MEIIKASGIDDVLRVIPNLLGFVPSESLVVLPLQNGRTIGAMRVNLPEPDRVFPVATEVAKLLHRTGATQYIVVVYTGEDHVRWAPFLDMLAMLSPADQAEAGYVADVGYGSYRDVTVEPLPLGLIEPDQALGSFTKDNKPDPLPEPMDKEEFFHEVAFLTGDPYEVALSQIDPAQRTLAQLAVVLSAPSTRDVLLAGVVLGGKAGERALKAQKAWEDGAEYPEDLAKFMWGEAPRPDVKALESLLDAARHVAVTTGLWVGIGGGYATCAWLSWALGRSSHAEWYAEQALDLESDHGLAGIVKNMVQGGHLPNWAFTK